MNLSKLFNVFREWFKGWLNRRLNSILDNIEGDPVPSDDPVEKPTHVSPQTGSMTFLWKPESDSDNNAVILFPWKYRYRESGTLSEWAINRIYIEGGDRDGDEPRAIYHPKKIDKSTGQIIEWTNGNRCHARMNKSGKKYGEDFDVVIITQDGEKHTWRIKKGKKRYTIS